MVTNILSYLEASARKYPDKPFLADERRSVTFAEAEHIARRIGTYLARRIPGRNQPVAVLIGRDVESVLMFLGVVESGNFYVPVNPELPRDRIAAMLGGICPVAAAGKSDDLDGAFACPFCKYEAMLPEDADDGILQERRDSAIDTDPLYAMFTSGSTGIPKAVLVSHRSIVDLVNAFYGAFDFSEKSVFGNQAALDFDISVKDIYCALKGGGRVEIIPRRLFGFPVELIRYINERKVNRAIWAVAALNIIAGLKGMKKIRPCLESVMFSGEAITPKTLGYWQEHLPDAEMVNLYGPTEITCNCTYFKIDRKYGEDERIPIGRPFPNTGILLLDGDRECGEGEMGELCVRGTCLALGYYNNPEKTAAAFVQNPLNPHYPERIYRTGDLARYDGDGNLVFCGRKDSQIKHMGYRIELGDIEAAADACPSIGRCCCLYDRTRDRIVLFYEAGEDRDKELRALLREKLPAYMAPGRYVRMDTFPANDHGKIDRKRLGEEFLPG